jgi:hypothetical protein
LTSGQIITSRAVEAVNAFYALITAGYPVELTCSEELHSVFCGDDNMGIVPHNVIPRYCSGMFLEDDNVNNYANLWSLLEDEDDDANAALLEKIRWYSQPRMELR